jgi:hypothetical protein
MQASCVAVDNAHILSLYEEELIAYAASSHVEDACRTSDCEHDDTDPLLTYVIRESIGANKKKKGNKTSKANAIFLRRGQYTHEQQARVYRNIHNIADDAEIPDPYTINDVLVHMVSNRELRRAFDAIYGSSS